VNASVAANTQTSVAASRPALTRQTLGARVLNLGVKYTVLLHVYGGSRRIMAPFSFLLEDWPEALKAVLRESLFDSAGGMEFQLNYSAVQTSQVVGNSRTRRLVAKIDKKSGPQNFRTVSRWSS
jgi:hypothetical protein